MKNIRSNFRELFILWIIVVWFGSCAPASDKSKPIKVACIGNSITYGIGISDRAKNSYPAVLGKLLGERYEVRNFGVSGRTLLRKGDYPYWNEHALQEALEFLPDVVVIKLGTNDSKPQNWKYEHDFASDYRALIDTLKNVSSHPKVFVCTPVPAFKGNWGISDSIIHYAIIPLIEESAKKKNVEIIDLYKALYGKEELFPDEIHPNEKGAALIAREVFKAISGS